MKRVVVGVLIGVVMCATPGSAAPVGTGPPNVPEFKPAFPGQTRAEAETTRTQLTVTEIASGFNKPWAIAYLPDGRFLVTEKPTGNLYVGTAEGVKSKPGVRFGSSAATVCDSLTRRSLKSGVSNSSVGCWLAEKPFSRSGATAQRKTQRRRSLMSFRLPLRRCAAA